MDIHDVPVETLPGVGFDFHDVTSVLAMGAAEIETGDSIFMEDFTLDDAMGALEVSGKQDSMKDTDWQLSAEVGEPRLDSGLLMDEEDCVPFNPLSPLLPHELCWILDRAFSYEMAWHEGNSLSQTVFTLTYVHHLSDMDLEYMSTDVTVADETSSIPELIFIVLKASVLGLLKCCDLSWRELGKHNVQDNEDWQSDKSDISLLEGLPAKHVLAMLEDAEIWLANTTKKIPTVWRNALHSRLSLRKNILKLMQCDIFVSTDMQDLVNEARQCLTAIRSHPVYHPGPTSQALRAFDPRIGGRLKTFVPLRIIPPKSSEETWRLIDELLDGWQELCLLSRTYVLSTWEMVGNIHAWLPHQPPQIPYLRSSTQSVFYDGLLVLNKFTFSWIVDRFFYETLGVSYNSLARTIKDSLDPVLLSQMEHVLSSKLMTPYIAGLWLNPPRRRRHMAKALYHWHVFYDILVQITIKLETTEISKDHIALLLPHAALIWRLSFIREVVLSGFQLDLYGQEERPIAYWYTAQVLDTHLSCLDDLVKVVPSTSDAYRELQFQHQLLTALQSISIAVFVSSMTFITFNWSQLCPAFYRRYKWAFIPEYKRIQTPPIAHPNINDLLTTCTEALQDESYSPAGSVEVAEKIISGLIESGNVGGWAGLWAPDRRQFLLCLFKACKGLRGLPKSIKELEFFNAHCLTWDSTTLWFPSIRFD